MASEVVAGGCERCGRTEEVVYHHWQFLCRECLEVLTDESHKEHDHALLMARVEREMEEAAAH